MFVRDKNCVELEAIKHDTNMMHGSLDVVVGGCSIL